jgi:hypothetical protein
MDEPRNEPRRWMRWILSESAVPMTELPWEHGQRRKRLLERLRAA